LGAPELKNGIDGLKKVGQLMSELILNELLRCRKKVTRNNADRRKKRKEILSRRKWKVSANRTKERKGRVGEKAASQKPR